MHPAQYLATVKKSDVKANITAMWCMPYPADPLLEPDLEGLTYGQVILQAQMKKAVAGDGDAMDRVLDRMIGKAEQVNKNLNVNGTYAEFMEMVAKQEGIIDAEVTIHDNDS